MAKLHWRLNNHFQHHGGAGFHALGFDPSKDLRQSMLTFMFDDDAMKRSEAGQIAMALVFWLRTFLRVTAMIRP